jgi:hypothetical protein
MRIINDKSDRPAHKFIETLGHNSSDQIGWFGTLMIVEEGIDPLRKGEI